MVFYLSRYSAALKYFSAAWTCSLCDQPAVEASCAEQVLTFGALFRLPDDIFANQANVVGFEGLSDARIVCNN